MPKCSIPLLPSSFLSNFPVLHFYQSHLLEIGKKNIHLRQATLRCCKKKSQHKTTIDIRILLCAWGITHLHSAKLCNREVEKNCRNCFEDKQTKKCFCWAIIRFACRIRCLFLVFHSNKENAWRKLLVLIFTHYTYAAAVRLLLW